MCIESAESETLEEIDRYFEIPLCCLPFLTPCRFCDAVIQIQQEVEDTISGKQPWGNNFLRNASHPLSARVGSDREWNRQVLRPVLLAGRDGEQRWFGGRRDLDCSAPRVRWLHTPLHGKAEAQGTRPSKPEKKGTHPIGNSRGIAVRVGRLLSGSGKALDTFLCPLHESGLVEGKRM